MDQPSFGAILLAAGQSTRMGTTTAKPYLELNGKPILQYSLEKFLEETYMRELILVVEESRVDALRSQLPVDLQLPTYTDFKVVAGGRERQDSSLAGVHAATTDWVFIHDAARPLFPSSLLAKLREAAVQFGAAIPTLPVVDSLREIDGESWMRKDIPRKGLHAVQTPQCFKRNEIEQALELAREQRTRFTDDAAALFEMLKIPVKAIPGAQTNFKITTSEDLQRAELTLKFPDLFV